MADTQAFEAWWDGRGLPDNLKAAFFMVWQAAVASHPAEVDEPKQILNSMTHTARRDHLCAFCGMTVQKNERYVRAQSPGGAQAKKPFHSKCYTGLAAGMKKGK